MKELFDLDFYASNFIKIKQKSGQIGTFKMRSYQRKLNDEIQEDFKNLGFCRKNVLKPRQAGLSTYVAAYGSHRSLTNYGFSGIVLADQASRTDAVFGLYKYMIENVPKKIQPSIGTLNTREYFFDKLKSGMKGETANDKNAGKSESRLFAQLSEYAFYRYAKEINESVQNSVPLKFNSLIIKETTANGRDGIGKNFYEEWQEAKKKTSLYSNYFISWFEIEDYFLELSNPIKKTKEEIDLQKQFPGIKDGNIAWRRLKLMEMASQKGQIAVTPEEWFNQDFPASDDMAFLFSGRPVFCRKKLGKMNEDMRNKKEQREDIGHLTKKFIYIQRFLDEIKIYKKPEKNKSYSMGCDVSEGLEEGDNSTIHIIETKTEEHIVSFCGRIDVDLFGNLVVDLAEFFNDALIVPEINSMGSSVLSAIKARSYSNIYRRKQKEVTQISDEVTSNWGWRTTFSSKQEMIATLGAKIRDDYFDCKDKDTVEELLNLVKESNGDVILNSKDRCVAVMLSNMGLEQARDREIKVTRYLEGEETPQKEMFERHERFKI